MNEPPNWKRRLYNQLIYVVVLDRVDLSSLVRGSDLCNKAKSEMCIHSK